MTPKNKHHEALVRAANEIYHDLEGEEYSKIHPEIFTHEGKRWNTMARAFLQNKSTQRTWIDIGCGTGFVGMQLRKFMNPGDIYVCADISTTMLQVAFKNLAPLMENVAIRTQKLTDETLPFESNFADVIVMNSVLHHIPDVQRFLQEIERVLKPNGILMIGHEPNAMYADSDILRLQEKVLRSMHPKRWISKITMRNKTQEKRVDSFLIKVNDHLQAKGLITMPISRETLATLVDVHSPTAGGIHRKEGFYPQTLLQEYAPSIQTLRISTYNHLGKLSGKDGIYAPYEKILQVLLPCRGATFFLVGKKCQSMSAPV